MDIISCFEPESCTWTYLLADESSALAAIIDPVWVYDAVSGKADTRFIDGLLEKAQEKAYQIEWVLETHAHADHLTAADYVKTKTGARIAAGIGICDVQKTVCKIFDLKHTPCDGSQFDRLLCEGDKIKLGGLEIMVMETPGHTSDSVVFIAEDAAFIGDTLFSPALGSARCDFPGGDAGQLFDSIQRIYTLPDNTRLFLCHDYPESGDKAVDQIPILESKKSNIHVKPETTKTDFVSLRNSRDKNLSLPRLIMPSLQVNIRAGRAPAPADNDVSYLSVPFNTTIPGILKNQP
jgi:glyoxylase-like metal-dependent hydrolase (beta-lactamase superfamily II)